MAGLQLVQAPCAWQSEGITNPKKEVPMTQRIPVTVAVDLINARNRAEASLAQIMVLHEAVALLTGHLHRAGLVDADGLAADLLQAFADPRFAELAPGVVEQAETTAGRILGAAHLPHEPGEGRPGGS